jgi:acyl carrier protein
MIAKTDVAAIVMAVVAETFASGASNINRDTTAADVDGWDSLAHTVLMIRLEKRLGISISDRIAAKASSVGELIDLLCTQTAAEGRP